MRELLACEACDERAAEAIALFCYPAAKAIGSFAAALEGVDTLVFSGGIGESAAVVRRRICERLRFLGLELDAARNERHAAIISTPASRVGSTCSTIHFPGGIPSHTSLETPGSIHEGGELGYSLPHAFGAVFDDSGLVVACVIGVKRFLKEKLTVHRRYIRQRGQDMLEIRDWAWPSPGIGDCAGEASKMPLGRTRAVTQGDCDSSAARRAERATTQLSRRRAAAGRVIASRAFSSDRARSCSRGCATALLRASEPARRAFP